MIADGGAGTAVWQRITALPNSRFVMLGTPNLGSHEAVRWLTGCNPTQQKLALLDLTQTTTGVTEIVRDYAGLLELLPFDPAGADFADAARWKALRAELSAVWPLADAGALREARKTWQRLLNAAPDPRHMIYLAGLPAGDGGRLPRRGIARLGPRRRPPAGVRCHRRRRRHRHLGLGPAARRAGVVCRGHRPRRLVHPEAGLPRPARPAHDRHHHPPAGHAAAAHPCRGGRADPLPDAGGALHR
ncbi:MAG: hypothetical protein R3E34_13360 [Rhodocyclaceae bacterium]